MTTNDAVQAVIEGVYKAWEDHDPDAFVTGYADAATAVLPGSFLADKEAIRAAMAEGFAGQLKGSRPVFDIQSIRCVGADAAIVIGKSAIVFPGNDEPSAETRARDTWVLSRQAGDWLVESFQSSPENAA
jgi:uncharacterized protein (TIGR02246 family)